MKIHKIIFITTISLIIFCIPLLSLSKNSKEKNASFINNIEKRHMAQFQTEDSEIDISSGIKSFENYFNDSMPFRDTFISTLANMFYKTNVSYLNSDVVFGKSGFMFFKPSLDYHTCKFDVSDESIYKSACALDCIATIVESSGVPFIYSIAPDKVSIYNEYLPKWVNYKEDLSIGYRIENQAKQFSEYNYDVNYLDKMIEAKSEYGDYLYINTDTHWSQLGGYVAYRNIMDKLNQNSDEKLETLENISYSTSLDYSASGDLEIMGALESQIKTSKVNITELKFDVKNGNSVIDNSSIGFSTWTSKSDFSNEKALNDATLLHFGDSFTTSILPYYNATFSKVYALHINHSSLYFSPHIILDLIEEYDADYVIIQLSEKYSDHVFYSFDYYNDEILSRAVADKQPLLEVYKNMFNTDNSYTNISFDGQKYKHYIVELNIENPKRDNIKIYYGNNNTFEKDNFVSKHIEDNHTDVYIDVLAKSNFDCLKITFEDNADNNSINSFKVFKLN